MLFVKKTHRCDYYRSVAKHKALQYAIVQYSSDNRTNKLNVLSNFIENIVFQVTVIPYIPYNSNDKGNPTINLSKCTVANEDLCDLYIFNSNSKHQL